MTWAVAWRPLAERDLIDCAAHIAQDNTDAALRFIDTVEETVASLAENPMLSTATHFVHPDLAGIRRRVVNGFKRYLIFYGNESATQTVEFVRILPGERDLLEALIETAWRATSSARNCAARVKCSAARHAKHNQVERPTRRSAWPVARHEKPAAN